MSEVIRGGGVGMGIGRTPYFKVKTIYPRSKGPTEELYSSSRRTVVLPLLKNYMQFFWLLFWAG